MCKNDIQHDALPPYPAIHHFNRLWHNKVITTPLCLFVSGYAGTGKSTLVESIQKHIQYLTSFSTGFARASAQTFITYEQNPALYKNTFSLHELSENVEDFKSIIKFFLKQREPVNDVIKNVLNFIATEKRHVAVEGNHVSPAIIDEISNDVRSKLITIDVYVKVTSPMVHKKMLEGPTHNRILTGQEFATARILHDYLVNEAELAGKIVFEYHEAELLTLRKIDSLLTKVIEKYLVVKSC